MAQAHTRLAIAALLDADPEVDADRKALLLDALESGTVRPRQAAAILGVSLRTWWLRVQQGRYEIRPVIQRHRDTRYLLRDVLAVYRTEAERHESAVA